MAKRGPKIRFHDQYHIKMRELVAKSRAKQKKSMRKEFVLTDDVKGILLSRGKDLVCCLCRKSIKVGERVHRNAKATRYYHKDCFEKIQY